MNKWIPLSKEMPIIGEDVLLCDLDGDIYVSYLHLNGGWGFEYCGNEIKNVVAWMPLPEPYKPESGNDMTKEEAINVLNDYDINFERNTAEEIAEAHEMAIKAIRTIPSEDEKVIRIKKGTLKVRTGRYVIYDVEWLKTHFNTTEAKIYGQPKVEGTRGDIPLQQSVPKMPQPNERTETHECDYISRKLMHDMGATCIAARNENGDLVALGALDMLPSVKFEESEVKG